MSQLLVLFGATGVQGGSVINHVLADSELSKRYSIRGITRDASSEKAQKLTAKGIEVRQGDASDRKSLDHALTDAHTVFIMTNPSFGPNAVQEEFDSAKNVADAAVAAGAQYIIFSTLPSPTAESSGKYARISMFDAKAKAEEYIRTLPVNSAFCSLGSFMENYITVSAPRKAGDKFVMALPLAPETRLPLVNAGDDTGKFIGAILASPDKYAGKRTYGTHRLYRLDEIADVFSKVTGENVVYQSISVDEFKARIPFGADLAAEALCYFGEFGYYGPNTEQLVASTGKDARGQLCGFEDFLRQYGARLD